MGYKAFLPWRNNFEIKSFKVRGSFLVYKLKKNENAPGKPLYVTISIGNELYQAFYPYSFPSNFFTYRSQHDMLIKLQIIESLCQTKSLEKVFYLEDFLSQFSRMDNQKQREIKDMIVEEFHSLLDSQCIEGKFILIEPGKPDLEVEKLNSKLFNYYSEFYYYENIPYNQTIYEQNSKFLKDN